MESNLATLLRTTRTDAGLSQLALALRLGVSQRHLNFIERGRARPSRPLLLAWMREVAGSSWLGNAALLLAGHAPLTVRARVPAAPGSPDSPATPPAGDAAVLHTITLHEPYPAIAFDIDWRAVRVNAGARWLGRLLMPEAWDGREPLDMLAVLAHPRGWLARARDPAPIAAALLGQLRAEQWVNPALGPRIDALEHDLRARFRLPDTPGARDPAATCFHVAFDTSLGPLAFAAVQALVALPHDAVGRLRVELWFPSDAPTAGLLRSHQGEMLRRAPADQRTTSTSAANT